MANLALEEEDANLNSRLHHLAEQVYDPNVEFELLETMRFDKNLTAGEDTNDIIENTFLFQSHVRRLQMTISYLQWDVHLPEEVLRAQVSKAIQSGSFDVNLPYKIRVLLSKAGNLTVQVHGPIEPRVDMFSGLKGNGPTYTVYLDKQPCQIGVYTSFKTTHRPAYNEARKRLPNKSQHEEVLLYNSKLEITEGSITNVAFWRDGKWKTPPLTSGCLCGVVRQKLVHEGIVEESVILLSSVVLNEKVLLFNGVMGVVLGEIAESPKVSY